MSKQVILFVIALVIIAVLVVIGYRNGETTQVDQGAAVGTAPSGNPLSIQDTLVGTGAEAKTGDTVTVHYVGKLTDGTTFDSSVDRGEPFTFTLGAGQVIRGWDEGLVGMKVGGTRMLTISPEFGYGANAVGPIPANSTLIFEVQLISVTGATAPAETTTTTTEI